MDRKSRGLVTPEKIADKLLADLAGMLNGLKQNFYNDGNGISNK